MSEISLPSFNPAAVQSKTGYEEFVINKVLEKIEKVTPAKIISYDRLTNRAVVQPLCYRITSTGETVPDKTISDIPVWIPCGGGFAISFPIKENDIGWLVSADRDISIFKKLLQLFAPATFQKHKYKDSFFLPDKVNGFTIAAEDEDSLLFTSIDGNTKISLSNGNIKMQAATVEIVGSTNIQGTLTASKIIAGNGTSGTYTNSITSEAGIVTGGS